MKFANTCVDCHEVKYLLIEYFNCYAHLSHIICEQHNAINTINAEIDEMSGKKAKLFCRNDFTLLWSIILYVSFNVCSLMSSSFMLLWVHGIYAVQYVCNQLWKKKSLTSIFCQVFQNKYFFLSHNMKLSHRMIACWTPTVQNR